MKKNIKGNIAIVSGVILYIFFIITVLVTFFIGFKLYKFISDRINNIEYKEIDKESLSVSTENAEKSKLNKIKTVLLIGSDSQDTNDMYAGRSDAIIVASINPENYSVKLLSIPRDSYVNIEGRGMDKINHSYAFGQEELLINTINSNFGLDITDFITIDFLGLVDVINTIGGINLNITEDEMKVINMYLPEIYEWAGKDYVPMTEYGDVLLNGEQALAHCRDRYVGNEFTREERHRAVLQAIISKIVSFENSQKMKFIDEALKMVKTNIKIGEYIPTVIDIIMNVNKYTQNIISAQVPSMDAGYPYRINNIYYYIVDFEKVKQEFNEYIFEK